MRRLQVAGGDCFFAACRDGDIVEMRRPDSARNWRRAIRPETRALPSRATDRAADPTRRAPSQAMVIWGYR